MKKLLILLILSFFSAQGFSASCPDGSEPIKSVSADKLFNMLPSTLQHKFTELFEEYLNQTTIEARLVKSADKLMPLIQNLCTNNEYSSYRKLEVDYQEAKDYLDKYFKTDGILKQMYETLLQEAKVKGVFFNNTQNT